MHRLIRSEYRRLRGLGFRPPIALDYARTARAWRAAERAGLVELIDAPDDSGYRWDDLVGDLFNPRANPDIPAAKLEREQREYRERVDRLGVTRIEGRYRLDPDSDKWELADLVGGFIGDDWRDSGYDADVRAETLSALRAALRARRAPCAACGRR